VHTCAAAGSSHAVFVLRDVASTSRLPFQTYDSTCGTGVESDRRGNAIQNHRALLSARSGEYWSAGQRRHVEAARDGGVHLALLTSDWQTATFAQPVTITAGATDVASYHAPAGRYSLDEGYVVASRTSGPLTAAASGTSGGNGVYRYASGAGFPTSSYASSNYWVDVVFTTGAQ
jgi:hypothetical protein